MFEHWEQTVETLVITYGPRLLGAVITLAVGYVVARILTSSFAKLLGRMPFDEVLETFLANLLHWVLISVVVVVTLGQLGVDTTAISAGAAGAGVVLGLAFKDSLANMIAGLSIIARKLFDVGDFVEAGGTAGTVEGVTISATQLRTADNKLIVVPNSNIASGNIVNYSTKPTRRIDLVVGVSYGDDIRRVKSVLREILDAEPRILSTPAPIIAVSELGDSSVDLVVRPWVETGDYWPTRFDLLEEIKRRFDDEGITIPFPQRDVHLLQAPAAV